MFSRKKNSQLIYAPGSLVQQTGQNVENPIRFGARLSGKINNNLRLGILNMQAAALEDIEVPEINYTVAVLQQKIFSRSNLSFLFVNKQDLENTVNPSINQYNRVLGVDYNICDFKTVSW